MRRRRNYDAAMKRNLRDHGIDADEVWPGVYQGSMPRHGLYLKQAGFDVLVLCAVEYQPSSKRFPGVEVLHVPLDDQLSGLTRKEWVAAGRAAVYCAEAAQAGATVLITCAQGINRSGVVSAMTISALTGYSGYRAAGVVQQARAGALRNTTFVEQLGRIPESTRPRIEERAG